jgi:hypothetical protein
MGTNRSNVASGHRFLTVSAEIISLLTVKPGAKSVCLQTDRRGQGCKVAAKRCGLPRAVSEAQPKYGRSQPRHDADQPVYNRNFSSLEITCMLSDQDGEGWNAQNGRHTWNLI